jgi:diguanylate cyclase (GGDEF)-like protein/PAS domain S-box-containing protein
MRRLFQRQLAKATKEPGKVDLELLAGLVTAAYEEADRDRKRTDRSISLMADELQRTHARLLEAFKVVPEGLVLLDAEGRYVLFNKKFLELFDSAVDRIAAGGSFAGSLRAGVERGHYLDAIGREEEWLAERLDRSKQDGYSTEQHLRGDRWVRIDERRTADGGSIAVCIDITEPRRREEILKKRSEQLVEAQRLAKTGDWSYKLGDSHVWWSPQLYELLAYDPAELTTSRDVVLAGYRADGAERLVASHAEVVRSGKSKSVDVKVDRGDGTVADIVVTSSPMTDDDGRIIGFVGTMQDITDRKIAEEQLEKLAYFDPLTGLANRSMFHREVNDVLTRCGRTGSQAALLLLDLDRFKEVNDSLGHASGDELLAKVAQLISRVLGNSHFFSRLGGDEFAIVMQGGTERAAVERLAADVIAAVSGSILLDRGEVSIGTSIGVAMIPGDGGNLTDLQRNADLALYRAKESGRGRVVFFEPGMNTAVQHKIAIARELRRAITENVGLTVHYQPQVSLSNGRVTGFEALMRWNHPTLGNIPPAEFIPIAESSQLICDLGLWILRQAALQAKTWLDAGEAAREIAVNVSAAQIWHTDFVHDVAEVLKETGLPPHLLCLELTESLLADHAGGRVRGVLTALKRLGVTLALDDFGTGYSSLGYLTQLPFDTIKIDRIFVDGIANSESARKLLEGIIALGRGLGMTIVAEGAETADEVAILGQFRCDLVQGYIFARPAAAKDALKFAWTLEGRGLRVDGSQTATSAAAA